jgi:hypothetical protein
MTIYTQTARFDHARALTEDELRKIAPSVFATTAHDSRSERFRPIPTIDVLRGLAQEGFSVVGAKQAVTRTDDRKPFTKHLLRLRRLDEDRKHSVGGTVAEMLLKNANDGSSVYDLFAGLFRIECLNSLVSVLSTLDTVKVRHSGNVIDRVIEGTYRVLESAKMALAAPDAWSSIQLDRDERTAFAEAAHVVRFGDAEGNVHTPVRPEQLLIPRRTSDYGSDLWRTFNVAQENTMRGGLSAMGRDAHNRPRRTTTREVKGIDQDVKLNKALWLLADKMAELKTGHRLCA